MDLLSIIGVVAAFSAVLMGQFLEGGTLTSLLNGPALLIVLGGTLGAVLLETPIGTFRRALQMIHWVILPPKTAITDTIEKIVAWSFIARRQGLLGLESVIENEPDEFIKSSVQMLVDGGDPKTIRSILDIAISESAKDDLNAVRLFESMGGYSPTIGIIGAVIGLIQVMQNLTDPSRLGAGIAVAFVATIYGVGFANLICLPMANKLAMVVKERERLNRMVLEGVLSISEGENPRLMRIKLLGYVQ